LKSDQIIGGGVDFNSNAGEFVEEAFVVHLEGEGAVLNCGGVFELQNFDGRCADGLSDGDAGDAG